MFDVFNKYMMKLEKCNIDKDILERNKFVICDFIYNNIDEIYQRLCIENDT